MHDPARSADPAPAPKSGLRKHRFLAYGFAISLIVHLLIGPWIHAAPPATAVPDAAQPFTFEKASPPPVLATPEPTPPPATPTPQPLVHAAPAPPAASEVEAPHRTPTYDAPPAHREPGTATVPSTTTGDAPIPGGSGDGPVVNPGIATEGPTVATTIAPTIAPTATPTPPPTCPNPNAAPSTLIAAPPETPEIAREQGVSGTVIVEVRLDAGSRIVATSVREGPPALRAAALAAARQSTFQTQIRDCKPLGASYLYVVEFQSQ